LSVHNNETEEER
jgi:protein kinase X